MPLFHGLTDAGLIVPIRLDASRNLQVAFDTASNPVKVYGEETTRQVKTAEYGKTVAGLKQSSLPLNFYDAVAATYTIYGLLAGTNSVTLYNVPAGVTAVFTNMVFSLNARRATSLAFFNVLRGGINHTVFAKTGMVANEYYDRQGQWILAPGDVLQGYIFNATAGDNLYFDAIGYYFTL